MAKRVLLGMSGGVDSSVSAVLLKQAGYEVVGATMKLCNLPKEEQEKTIEDAKKVCEILEIPHYVFDLREEFHKKVISEFIKSYQNALTPNPCIECNKELKFKAFYQKAVELGCEKIATGHYAKIEKNENYQQYVLKRSKASQKDQTYFLYQIEKEMLSNVLFPLCDFTDKEEVRKVAKQYGLPVASKSDSQEICFIPDNDYATFILKNSKQKQENGDIVTKTGKILGKHKGLLYYTVGQRKGLGISYQAPLYVLALDKEKNKVIVGTEKELYQKEVWIQNLNFLLPIDVTKPVAVMAKVRYRAKEAKAILQKTGADEAKLIFEEPQRAITPGQSVVCYIDDIVLGGGKIIKKEMS